MVLAILILLYLGLYLKMATKPLKSVSFAFSSDSVDITSTLASVCKAAYDTFRRVFEAKWLSPRFSVRYSYNIVIVIVEG